MKIDFDNINTYPIEIMRYALENEFEDYNKTDFDVPVPEFFYDILDKYDFIVYHCTRTVNINSFKRNGILIPEDKKLKKILFEETNGCDINDVGEFRLGRGLDIQFVFSYEEICNDKQYENFFNHIGGEIIEYTNKYNKKKLEKGNCYIIKFLIKGSEILYKRWLVQKMIRRAKFGIIVDFSGSVTHYIAPEKILDCIEADNIYKKLKEMN